MTIFRRLWASLSANFYLSPMVLAKKYIHHSELFRGRQNKKQNKIERITCFKLALANFTVSPPTGVPSGAPKRKSERDSGDSSEAEPALPSSWAALHSSTPSPAGGPAHTASRATPVLAWLPLFLWRRLGRPALLSLWRTDWPNSELLAAPAPPLNPQSSLRQLRLQGPKRPSPSMRWVRVRAWSWRSFEGGPVAEAATAWRSALFKRQFWAATLCSPSHLSPPDWRMGCAANSRWVWPSWFRFVLFCDGWVSGEGENPCRKLLWS